MRRNDVATKSELITIYGLTLVFDFLSQKYPQAGEEKELAPSLMPNKRPTQNGDRSKRLRTLGSRLIERNPLQTVATIKVTKLNHMDGIAKMCKIEMVFNADFFFSDFSCALSSCSLLSTLLFFIVGSVNKNRARNPTLNWRDPMVTNGK